MPPNEWNSREPPSLGPIPPERRGGGAPAPELLADPDHDAPPTRRRRAPIEDHDYAVLTERRGGFGRKLVYAFLALVALIAVGLGVLVAAPPVDLVRSHVVAEVERQKIGRAHV